MSAWALSVLPRWLMRGGGGTKEDFLPCEVGVYGEDVSSIFQGSGASLILDLVFRRGTERLGVVAADGAGIAIGKRDWDWTSSLLG